MPRDARWLFPRKDGKGPLPIEVVDKTLYRANEPSEDRPLGRFGIPHWTPHDLRRTALTNFAATGHPARRSRRRGQPRQRHQGDHHARGLHPVHLRPREARGIGVVGGSVGRHRERRCHRGDSAEAGGVISMLARKSRQNGKVGKKPLRASKYLDDIDIEFILDAMGKAGQDFGEERRQDLKRRINEGLDVLSTGRQSRSSAVPHNRIKQFRRIENAVGELEAALKGCPLVEIEFAHVLDWFCKISPSMQVREAEWERYLQAKYPGFEELLGALGSSSTMVSLCQVRGQERTLRSPSDW